MRRLREKRHVCTRESQSAERLSYVGDVAPRLAFLSTHDEFTTLIDFNPISAGLEIQTVRSLEDLIFLD